MNATVAGAPLRAVGLGKRYDGRTVLAGVSLDVEQGSVLGLVGRNGAGKSTLIRALLGLIEVDAGHAEIWVQPSLRMDDAAKARLGYVPQQPGALGWLEVGQMFDFVGRFYPRWDAGYVSKTLERWELPRNKMLAKLSPGETVLFSTHIMSDLERVASHVAFMQGGRIVLHAELDSLKERHDLALEDLFIEVAG